MCSNIIIQWHLLASWATSCAVATAGADAVATAGALAVKKYRRMLITTFIKQYQTPSATNCSKAEIKNFVSIKTFVETIVNCQVSSR